MITLSGTFKAGESCDQTKSMITLSGTFKAGESCDQTKSMITLSGTFKAGESCDQTKSMITLSGTFKAGESCDQTRAQSIFGLHIRLKMLWYRRSANAEPPFPPADVGPPSGSGNVAIRTGWSYRPPDAAAVSLHARRCQQTQRGWTNEGRSGCR
jgi:hypothetical protein